MMIIETLLLCFHCSWLSVMSFFNGADGSEENSKHNSVRILQQYLVLMENFQDETYPTTSIQLALYRQATLLILVAKLTPLIIYIGKCVNISIYLHIYTFTHLHIYIFTYLHTYIGKCANANDDFTSETLFF